MPELPSLIAFGSLGILPSEREQRDLREALLRQEHLTHVKEAVARPPGFWETLLANDSTLAAVRGRLAAEQLAIWMATGEAISRGVTLPSQNILTLPLTILGHLCDHMEFARQAGSHVTILSHVVEAGGIQGSCSGLLSALAVAGSRSEEEISVYGALAIRLAFAVGAYVDLDSARSGQTSCLALRWKPPSSLDTVEQVLDKYSESYISVLTDTNDAIVVVPASCIADVTRHLSGDGVTVLQTGLAGRYHTQDHQGVPEKVLRSCEQYGGVRFGEQRTVRSNIDGEIAPHEDAAVVAISSILLERSSWHLTISKAAQCLSGLGGSPFILAVGSDSVPPSIARKVKVTKAHSMAPDTMRFTLGASSGLTRCRRFKGVTLGDPGEPDPQVGDGLGELGGAVGEPSE